MKKIALCVVALALSACQRNAVDRLIGLDDNSSNITESASSTTPAVNLSMCGTMTGEIRSTTVKKCTLQVTVTLNSGRANVTGTVDGKPFHMNATYVPAFSKNCHYFNLSSISLGNNWFEKGRLIIYSSGLTSMGMEARPMLSTGNAVTLGPVAGFSGVLK